MHITPEWSAVILAVFSVLLVFFAAPAASFISPGGSGDRGTAVLGPRSKSAASASCPAGVGPWPMAPWPARLPEGHRPGTARPAGRRFSPPPRRRCPAASARCLSLFMSAMPAR
jgi:hypothetical protein